MSPPDKVEIFETPLLTGWLGKHGIFYAVSTGGERTVENYKILFDLYKKLSDNGKKKICTVQDITKTQLLTIQASKYVYGKHPKYLKAMALISDSPIGKATGTFFIRLKPTEFPMLMCADLEEAIKWLKQYS